MRAALVSEGPPKYERKPVGSAVDAVEDANGAQLKAVPTMPATLIAERVRWMRGMTVFKERVRELRPAYLPPDPAARLMRLGISRSATCGFRRPRSRWGVQFGGCDGQIGNCLPIVSGWNYMVRLYRPRSEILNGSWTFPEAQPIS